MRIGEIFSKMKDEVFKFIDELLGGRYKSIKDLFTKNNRLFYLGLFLLIICLFLYLLSYLFLYYINMEWLNEDKERSNDIDK